MNTEVKISDIIFRNPIMNASGTFGLDEYEDYINFSEIGALVTKSVTQLSRQGNPPPRIIETEAGILNSVGIQNEGVPYFIENKLPKLKLLDTRIIVSISNPTAEDYKRSVALFEQVGGFDDYEINVSCPNLEAGGRAFGTSKVDTYNVVKKVKEISKKPVIVKLSPNVTDIVEIAKAAEAAGADALTVANTYIGMAVDLKKRKAMLANKVGGFSGAAIKPLTLRHVYNIHQSMKIPIIASGGVYTAQDALEYLMTGATCVQVGTANFVKPDIMEDIVAGIEKYMHENDIKDINDFIGCIN